MWLTVGYSSYRSTFLVAIPNLCTTNEIWTWNRNEIDKRTFGFFPSDNVDWKRYPPSFLDRIRNKIESWFVQGRIFFIAPKSYSFILPLFLLLKIGKMGLFHDWIFWPKAPPPWWKKMDLLRDRELIWTWKNNKSRNLPCFLKNWRPRRLFRSRKYLRLSFIPGKYDREPLDISIYLFFWIWH